MPDAFTRRSLPAGVLFATALWLTVAVVGGGSPARAQGNDVLYGALIMATNSEHPEAPPEELRAQAASLHTVFGYNQFRLLDQKRETLLKGRDDLLMRSREFALRVDIKGALAAGNGYALGLELLKQERVLVQADVKISRARPLFIRGPQVGKGQLLILLMML